MNWKRNCNVYVICFQNAEHKTTYLIFSNNAILANNKKCVSSNVLKIKFPSGSECFVLFYIKWGQPANNIAADRSLNQTKATDEQIWVCACRPHFCPKPQLVPHVPSCPVPLTCLPHPSVLGAMGQGCTKLPAPDHYLFPLSPAPTSPQRYPIASPAAQHLLLGENRLLGNGFLKQQLWLCYSLNFMLPAWNNAHAWLLAHLCIYNPLENDCPLPTGMCLPFCSLLFMADNTKRFKIESGVCFGVVVVVLVVVVFCIFVCLFNYWSYASTKMEALGGLFWLRQHNLTITWFTLCEYHSSL